MNLLEDEVKLIAERAMRKTADKIAAEMSSQIEAKANKGYATGKLAGSIKVDHVGPWTYEIYPTATSEDGFPYGVVLDQGRRAMWKTKHYFKFTGKDGATVYTQHVKAFRGTRYVRSTYNKFT